MDDPYRPTRPRGVTSLKVRRARELRHEMTPDEHVLWSELRQLRSEGYIFRRQQVIAGFIVDFFCFAAQLVVEVDGGIHGDQVEYDTARDELLTTQGLTVLRVSNHEVCHELPRVIQCIRSTCARRALPFPSEGEGAGG